MGWVLNFLFCKSLDGLLKNPPLVCPISDELPPINDVSHFVWKISIKIPIVQYYVGVSFFIRLFTRNEGEDTEARLNARILIKEK